MIRVMIADDHALVRRGLRQIVDEAGDMQMVAEAEDWGGVQRMLKDGECDVLLLDISMPGKSGIDILKLVRERMPKLAVLMLSMFPEDQYATRALKAGASGYLTKDTAPEKLVEAIRTVARGKRYITPEVAEALAETLAEGPRGEGASHETLSDREFETLKLIAAGRKLSEIAETMALSPKTVSVYRARLLAKMKLRNNSELTHYAVKHGLVE
ncbi:DNA-binding response regulator [Betaproteobacteria bacterium GR16-43]|nr:DNA-binding response regulator [Betaproteobacteria bacterium GR16-43]